MKTFGFHLYFYILIFLTFSTVSYCQTANYIQINGQSKKAEYSIFLQNDYGKLSGNLYYNLLNNNNLADYFQRIEFTGNLEKDSSFTFRKFTEENDFAVGNFKNKSFQSVFQLTDSLTDTLIIKNVIPLKKNQFQLFSTSKTVKLLPSEDSPEAAFEMTVLVPEFSQSSQVRKPVLEFLNISPDGMQDNMLDVQQQLDIEQNIFLNDYLKMSSLMEKDWPSFNWFKTSTIQMLYNNSRIFCLEKTMYAFTGGAHGMENNSYGIFNYLLNKQLHKSDIFNPDTDSILSILITNALKKIQNINPDSSLPDYQYFVKQVSPNENIYLTPAGLGFYYNSYEIAPYSTGQTNIFFRFDELHGLLKDEFEHLINESN